MSLTLDTPLSDVPGIGDAYARRLQYLKLHTVKDLIYHFPHRYEDWTETSSLMTVTAGQKITVQGQISNFKNVFTKYGKKLQTATISNDSGSLPIIWFNQTYLSRVFHDGVQASLSGKVDYFSNKLTLISPQFEIIRNTNLQNSLHTGRLVPIYPETAGLTSKWLRAKINYLLERVNLDSDWLSTEIKHSSTDITNLISLNEALHKIHLPENPTEASQARQRLAFDEIFFLQLEALARREAWQQQSVTHPLTVDQQQLTSFKSHLPFTLTNAQTKAVDEILHEMQRTQPMNRLLEGDVGSGKTVVAAAAAYINHSNGYQTAFMAPTEILAQQHFNTLQKLLEPLGCTVVLQTGRKKFIKSGQDDKFDIVVGTHALLTDIVNFDNLTFVIIDEQHRFGVEQRAKLINKGHAPHVLSMTATPIPRTIALTMYGDLDLSVLDELPPGRKPVKTWVVPHPKRQSSYDWIKQQLKTPNGDKFQMFVVCPFIEPSETISSVKSAVEEYDRLQKIFPEFKLGLLHGQLKGPEKDAILDDFKNGHIDILVTTPVVEVGVDIPQATIMLIEGAERFGLAQLHQLRGRVGRSSQQSYCLLFTSEAHQIDKQRLKAMETTHSGLKLAEVDLEIRGPGQVYGTQQHGYDELKLASYSDLNLITQARNLAQKLLPNLQQYPDLRKMLESRKIHHVVPN